MMSNTDLSTNDWIIHCSDDEISNCGTSQSNVWIPDPKELEALYNEIDKNSNLTLTWKCPGRRAPSPVAVNITNQADQTPQTNQDEKSDFDFMDEVSSLRLRVRREGEDTLRGSAKKKTTSFDGIVSNIMRHKRLEQMEREATSMSPNHQSGC